MVNIESRPEIQADFYHVTANRRARIVLEQMIKEGQVSFGVKASVRVLRKAAIGRDETTAKGALTRLQASGVIEGLFQGPVRLLKQEELQIMVKRLRPQKRTI